MKATGQYRDDNGKEAYAEFPAAGTDLTEKRLAVVVRLYALAAVDGIYVLRTSLPAEALAEDDVVARYKGLEDVERFFRALNRELDVRPIRHRLADRVRAHLFLRMLSYYISWHMKQALAPIPFQDNDKPGAAAKRTDPIATAQRSDTALA